MDIHQQPQGRSLPAVRLQEEATEDSRAKVGVLEQRQGAISPREEYQRHQEEIGPRPCDNLLICSRIPGSIMLESVLPIKDEDPAGEIRIINASEPAEGEEGDALRQPRVGKPGDYRCE